MRYIWLSDLKDPIRFGAIGIPLMRNDLPPHLRPPLLSFKFFRHPFDHISLPPVPPSPIQLHGERIVGPHHIYGDGPDPYYTPLEHIYADEQVPFEVVKGHLDNRL